MKSGILKGKKTYVIAALAILTAWAAFLTGDIELSAAIQATFAALTAMAMRGGIASGTAAILLVSFLMVGCATSKQAIPTESQTTNENWHDAASANDRAIESLIYIGDQAAGHPINITITGSTFNTTVEQGRFEAKADAAAAAETSQAGGKADATNSNEPSGTVDITP